ncbi:hypothetical protein TELCIR_15508 [Teladorsagia circumcincta]|uniref:Tc1-like transposase DDE domain-containing protein n=1 Tax=Teladorsagia circumcincta TaxID=45464 RepID=A0A2G9TY62_TELCI|nr:hypothetical protein TELCIR_15508 [Teladorsagia circumcincta]
MSSFNVSAASPHEDDSEQRPRWERESMTRLIEIAESVSSLKENVVHMSSMVMSVTQKQDRIEQMVKELLRRNPARNAEEHYDDVVKEIQQCYKNSSSSTAFDILKRLRTRGISLSLTHIRNLRKQLGLKRSTTKYCHTIKDQNKAIRFRNRAKHPAKVHIWGGISFRGTTPLAILSGDSRIDSKVYCEIIRKCYLPFKQETYNGFCELVQDNAPPHTSRYTASKLQEWNVETVDWPPESPDLNPIEMVWGTMKNFVR